MTAAAATSYGFFSRLKQRERKTVRAAFGHVRDAVGQRALRGASFALLNTGLRFGLSLISTAVLARLLAPRDFGLIAMTAVFGELILLLGNFGLFNILVQKPKLYRIQLDTAFWLALMLGALITLLAYTFSSAAAAFFGEPAIAELIGAQAAVAFAIQLEVLPTAMLNRAMRFDLIVLCQVSTVVVRTVAAISFAYAGFGVWSFVLATLVGQSFSLVAFYIAAPFFPRFRFRLLSLRNYFKPALSYFGSGVLFYVNSYMDSTVVARRLGAVDVAFYQNGRQLADELRSRLLPALQSVLLPAFSALQHDTKRLQAACVRACGMFSLLYYPLGLGLAACADDVVMLLFGEKWRPMIPILQLLAAHTAVRGGLAGVLPVYRAKNLATLEFRNYVLLTILFVICVLVGSNWGATGVAYGILFCTIVGGLPIAIQAFHLIELGVRELIKTMGPPMISGVIMFVAVQIMLHSLIELGVPIIIRLVIEVMFGAIVFTAAMFLFGRSILFDAFSIAKEVIERKRG